MAFRVHIFQNGSTTFSAVVSGIVELGRQQKGEPEAVSQREVEGRTRIIVAALDNTWIARQQLQAEPDQRGRLRLTNLSSRVALRIRGAEPLDASATRLVSMPATVYLSPEQYVTFNETDPEPELESLAAVSLAPGRRQGFSDLFAPPLSRSPGDAKELERVVRVLQEAMAVFQNSGTTSALYDAAVTGAVKVVGFDGARILRYEGGVWKEELRYLGSPAAVSQHVLTQVLNYSRTFWQSGQGKETESLARLEAVIAAPILDRAGTVIGALYAERLFTGGVGSLRPINRIDAQLMELLAFGVASELARHDQEEEARRLQVRFARFFSTELALELEAQPNLLEGRDVDVSILFCDIRGFSRISEHVDAQTLFRFINHAIGAISECVVKNGGVIVDYVGDAVMAMWGAPRPQINHAELACLAAIDMLKCLPELNRNWHADLSEEVDFAIGINSGPARAGNSGSEFKYKYGPLGNTVNLASRVQSVTKHLRTRVLVTRSTADALNSSFHKRKICDGRVVNIQEPVGLYELSSADDSTRNGRYEKALAQFECGEFRIAVRQLGQLLEEFPGDGPTLVLLSRCVNAMVEGPTPEHPVHVFDSK